MHVLYCFADELAPCRGYFDNDILPCVCGEGGDILAALSQIAVPESISWLLQRAPLPESAVLATT